MFQTSDSPLVRVINVAIQSIQSKNACTRPGMTERIIRAHRLPIFTWFINYLKNLLLTTEPAHLYLSMTPGVANVSSSGSYDDADSLSDIFILLKRYFVKINYILLVAKKYKFRG